MPERTPDEAIDMPSIDRPSIDLPQTPSSTDLAARALVYTGPGRAELSTLRVAPPRHGELLVRTLWSGLSRGTERLVFEGRLPPSEWTRMRVPFQEGEFPFPVKYGYAAIGVVEEGPREFVGRVIFALHPHQDRFVIPAAAATVLPEATPPRRAVLAANMETALNAIWDAGIGPADRVGIVGGGVLGLLVAGLAAAIPGTRVTVIDPDASREAPARALGAAFALPDGAEGGNDVVIHTSATQAGLRLALDLAGFEGRIVELSWFGDREVTLPLGGPFHSQRLSLVSSQVGNVSPSRRPRWPHARRLAAALQLLADPRFDALVTAEVAFEDLPARLSTLLAPGAAGLATAILYPGH
jgi:2-desacetyl-2-hydroxyethyl bacteriochlorophyllide A dehydrogenase